MSELPSETGLASDEPVPQGPIKGPLQQHRGMVILVTVMGIMLVVGFGVLIGTIIYRAGGGNSQQDEALAAGAMETAAMVSIVRPAGATLMGATSSAGRLTLHFRDEAGDTVLVVDLAGGAVISRVEIPTAFTEEK